jgi:hypothetical protein
MEKIVDGHIRDRALRVQPLHLNKRAYQIGKCTETALHNVITHIESAIEHNDIALGAFLDIEGASDRTSFDMIEQAAGNHGIEPAICRWIRAMLESRTIISTLSGEILRVSAAGGCPQGGVLSPLLWSLVVDDLLWELNDKGYYTVGYADDTAILIQGKFPSTASECLQMALYTVQRWCERTDFPINPNKMVIVPFTRRRKIKNHRELTLFNKTIQFSDDVKSLGLVLNKGLTWKGQLAKVINKASKAFWTCRSMFGKTWGLRPHVMY